jgi:uncharacterized protein YndB with AHSA1/START domain
MNTTIGKLTIEAPADRPVAIMTRTFNAPRDLVFKAHSSCEHVSHWWGPRRHTFASCDMEFVEGGAWRFVLRNADTNEEYPFTGVFREIQAPERLTWTFIYDVPPFNEHEAVETIVFTEEDGRTTITTTSTSPSIEMRDGVLSSGMAEGAAETYDRLDEYVATLR